MTHSFVKTLKSLIAMGAFTVSLAISSLSNAADDQWVVYEGKEGPGKGKHIVFVSGDEEYRSEEACPMLAQVLAEHHGFKCTVLFAIDPDTGIIDPNNQTNIPGLAALDSADLMVIFTRFRELPDADMKHIVDFVNAGKPVIGLRTATHAFNYSRNGKSPYADWGFNSGKWQGGFGQQVLGDTWISHHGNHKVESTRGIIVAEQKDHPVLRGVTDVWGPTDVYGIVHLPKEASVLLNGQVLKGMKPTDEPVEGPKNNPMMPLAWVKPFKSDSGKEARIFCTTMGSSNDLESEGLRKLIVNACYWCVGMEDKIDGKAKVDFVSEYKPSMYGFTNKEFWKEKNMKPADFKLKK